jgi:hypothetical protein
MIPEPTTTLTSRAVPENSATAFPTTFATGGAFLMLRAGGEYANRIARLFLNVDAEVGFPKPLLRQVDGKARIATAATITIVLEIAAAKPAVAMVAVEKLKIVCHRATIRMEWSDLVYIQVKKIEPASKPTVQPIVPPTPRSIKLAKNQKSGMCQTPHNTQVSNDVTPIENFLASSSTRKPRQPISSPSPFKMKT